jgi:hypothetical protein
MKTMNVVTLCSKKELKSVLQKFLKDKLNPFEIITTLLFKVLQEILQKMEADCSDENFFLKFGIKNNAKNRRALRDIFCAFVYIDVTTRVLPYVASSSASDIRENISPIAKFLPNELLVPFRIICILLFIMMFIHKAKGPYERCSGFFELKRRTELNVKIDRLNKKLKRSNRSNYANCNFYGYDYGNGFIRFQQKRLHY